ncbi:Beta-glucanase, GH16 family [Streptomyces zhaozhouensis]|uniref:Beta-glucanase, GH16 family n=1 Tax=Streptomyces zhaozhouensis TaxID=1300267 RepID=A0A286DYL0_9ACTN|nr:polysaccharide lyase family 7 protein [Streptomyces zhaozhouensis]SOD63720.1 Beta-glucanase, GH16 family [Streptomyces zhaozhouensis]
MRKKRPARAVRRRGGPLALTALAAMAATLVVPTTAWAAEENITPDADAVTASTSDENGPGNAVDGDLTTRWSGEGDGAWLRLDLGSTATVSEVKLAVHQGADRRNVFELQYWDGSGWVTVHEGETSGTGTGLESFTFDPVETSRMRYLGHGYEGDGEGDWNSLTEVEVWGTPGEDDDGGGGAELPSRVLDLSDWKVTLPTGDDGDPTEIYQPELDEFAHDPYFRVGDSGDTVRFRAPVNGVTTGGSSYPRSELREMEPGGGDEIEWSSTSGTHTMTVREAFTHLPEERPHVVGAQIHGGDDDVTVIRLEGSELWITEGDTRHHHLITDDYELGTVFEVSYVVSDGEIEVYYNGELETTLDHSDSTNYFKAGAYTQANCGNSSPCDEDNYGEVEIHELTVTHQDEDQSGDGTEAAVRHGWGTPLPVSDEFDYEGPVDPERWAVPSGEFGGTEGCWEGHAGNGRRCAKNSVVEDGVLTITGEENGDTGWLRQRYDAQYGRWEIRSRSRNTGPEGGLYHPLHLIWPTSEERLEDGEYDWVEYTDPDADCVSAWMHYPDSPSDEKEHFEHCPVDMTEWHNFAFEWTPDEVVGYVDGEEWFRMADGADSSRGDIQDMPSGHLNIQLDNFTGESGLRPAEFEVGWVRVYE